MKDDDSIPKLIEASSETERASWALEAKREGRKVIGVLSEYVPEEIIHAAGMLPWRIRGTSSSDIASALVYRRPDSCLYCNHVLESLLRGEFDFLDGVVAVDVDQDLTRLWDVWNSLGKTPFTYILHVPYSDSDPCYRFFTSEVARFAAAIENFSGVSLDENKLLSSIKVYNRMRDLLARLYKLRKANAPPLSGTQVAKMVAAATVMPKEEYNRRLEKAIGWLERPESPKRTASVRLLLSSDLLDEFGYVELIEEADCLVAMDDLDVGSRYFGGKVEESGRGDLMTCLAKRYLSLPTHPRMFFWDRQASQIIQWAREYRVHGVLKMVQMYTRPRAMRTPFLAKCLEKEGIPFLSVRRDYCLSGTGQLRTRIGAFVEMLQQM